MGFSQQNLKAPFAGPLLFLGAVVGAYVFLLVGDLYTLASIPFLVVLYHGGHESIHGTLITKWGKLGSQRAQLNLLAGILAYAPVGHNFLLVKRSHQAHHWCGRLSKSCTIDGGLSDHGITGHIRYYALLLGLGCFLHEIAGYLYLFLPSRWVPLDIKFDPQRRNMRLYAFCQLIVAGLTLTFLFRGGVYFLICRFVYAMYWGFTQNVAHYGLEIGDSKDSRYAARTYRVSPILNFVLFGSVFCHLEHHLFPFLPGHNLSAQTVGQKRNEVLSVSISPRQGLMAYASDFYRQLKGPQDSSILPKEWRS